MTSAYVFWHWKQSGVAIGEKLESLRREQGEDAVLHLLRAYQSGSSKKDTNMPDHTPQQSLKAFLKAHVDDEILVAYHDQTLDDEAMRLRIAIHLGICAGCRKRCAAVHNLHLSDAEHALLLWPAHQCLYAGTGASAP